MNPISKFEFSALPEDLKGHVLTFIESKDLEIDELKATACRVITLMDKQNKSIFDKKIQEIFNQYKAKRIAELSNKYCAYKSKYDRKIQRCTYIIMGGYSDSYFDLRDEMRNNYNNPSYTYYTYDSFSLDKHPHLCTKDQEYLKAYHPARRPELLDALFTGCNLPGAQHSIDKYTPEVEKDIKDIVRLIPDSIHCRLGELRLRHEVSALGAACMNPNIPIHMIEWLLQHGANPNETWSELQEPSSTHVRIVDSLKYDTAWFRPDNNHTFFYLSDRNDDLLYLFARYGAIT